MPDQVRDSLKAERLSRLQDLLRGQQDRFNRGCVGRTLAVLFDRVGRHNGQLVGRSPYLQPVHAEAPADLLGKVVEVRIAAAHPNSLAGHAVGSAYRHRPNSHAAHSLGEACA
jgi:tRNA-2-methylthio-N6-dimethylallyladenosine synthase